MFSVDIFYDPFMQTFYETLFTLLPIIIYGIYDKSYPKTKLNWSPLLYFPGISRNYFNKNVFLLSLGKGILYSLFVILLSFSLFDWTTYQDGHSFGFWNFSNMCYLAIVFFVNFQVFVISNSFSFMSVFLNLFSTFTFILIWYWQNEFEESKIYKTLGDLIGSQSFFLMILVLLGVHILERLLRVIFNIWYEKKYIPDFEVKYDAKITGAKKVKIQIEGERFLEKDNFYQYES